ncbi:hypothetical protein SADO_06292 [Salinisphaera dokdonensis CL-ES53]|uniref:Uncharacterized protein n=1 Tax=Salinisphaera dokdonensis CL-ES53 TaxID=1304272 RepID=A0ABV2AYX7_9GAMM
MRRPSLNIAIIRLRIDITAVATAAPAGTRALDQFALVAGVCDGLTEILDMAGRPLSQIALQSPPGIPQPLARIA